MPNYETLSKIKIWRVNYKIGQTCRKRQFFNELYRIAKNLLQRGHGKDLVQLTPLHTMGQKGETH